MRPTKRAQPYRKGRARPAGRTLAAMLRGEPVNRRHPLSAKRKLRRDRQKIRAAVRR